MKIFKSCNTYIVCFLLLSINAFATYPVQINVNIAMPIPLELSKIQAFDFNCVVTITNVTDRDQYFNVKASFSSPNGFGMHMVDDDFLISEQIHIAAKETISLSNYEFAELFGGLDPSHYIWEMRSSKMYNLIQDKDILPQGNYTLCIEAISDNDSRIDSRAYSAGCGEFEVLFPERPEIVLPYDDSYIPTLANESFTIVWTVPLHFPYEQIHNLRYKVKIVDLEDLENLSPREALLDPTIPPFYFSELRAKDVVSNSITIQDLNFQTNRKYGMMVTAYDLDERIPFHFNGHSDVITFYYSHKSVTAPIILVPENNDVITEFDDPQFKWIPPLYKNEAIKLERTAITILDLSAVSLDTIENYAKVKELRKSDYATILIYDRLSQVSIQEILESFEIMARMAKGFFKHGKQYALALRCMAKNEEYIIENDGVSEWISFGYN